MATQSPPRPGVGRARQDDPAGLRRDTGSADTRRTLLALLASALGAFPLCQLFSDRGWLVEVWVTMAVVVVPAAVLRRRRAPSAVHTWLGVLLLVPWLTVSFVRDHALLGVIPTTGTGTDLSSLLTSLQRTISDEVAPVHTTLAVRLVLCAVLGLIAALVDLLAVVGRRGALAGVPLLVVYTVSGAVPRRPVGWLWFVLAAAGFLLLLALDSRDDLARWGHHVPRPGRAERRRVGASSGQRVAVAAVLLAVLVPLVVPSNSRNFVANLFHRSGNNGADGFGFDRTSGSGTGGIDPFAALRGQLIRNRELPLLSVRISGAPTTAAGRTVQPFYLRTNVLSAFTGAGWRPGQPGPTESLDTTRFASGPGVPYQPRVVRYTAELTISGLRSNPPVFADPTLLLGVSSATRWSPQDMLVVGSRVDNGQVIREDVAQPHPTVGDLYAATGSDPRLESYLALPRIAPFVRSLTAKIVAKAHTPYGKARALSNFFADPANGFQYSLETTAGDSSDDLTNFLTTRVGYCQQFAAAMGVMLRLSGVPARVVLGYAHDAPDRNGRFSVTTYDAHAWVEAYFAGIGWVPFDTTPLGGIAGGASNDLPWAPHQAGASATAGPRSSTASATAPSSTGAPSSGAAPLTAAPLRRPPSAALPLTAAAVAALAAALLLVPSSVRRRRRRARLRRARAGDTDAAWHELSDTAIDLGYAWSAARTPRQVVGWLGGGTGPAEALRNLAAAVERARYAPAAAGTTPGSELVRDLAAVTAGMRSRRSSKELLRAWFWPASLRWHRPRWAQPRGARLRRH